MESNQELPEGSKPISWAKLPIPVRAVLSGLFVFFVFQAGSGFLLGLNMRLAPTIPWSLPVGLAFLWISFEYFGGRWAPKSTSLARKEALGARRLTGVEWKLALPASIFLMIFIIGFAMLNYRLVAVPEDAAGMPDLPLWSIIGLLLLVSFTAGVAEEAGFRGYIQRPLERRFGALTAIGISAVLFWVAHLNHASGVARMPSLIVMGIALGSLAWAADSILPAILTHATADSIVFIGASSGIGPEYLWSPPLLADSGVDTPFAITILITVVTGIGGAILIGMMSNLRIDSAASRR